MNIKTIGLAITLLLIRMLKRVNKEVELIVEEILFKFASSVGNLHFEPPDTAEVVNARVKCLIVKFCPDQLLVSSNLKCFNSSSILPDNCITIANCYKSFFSAVEVYLQDKIFILSDNALYLSDLLGRIKVMSSFEVKFASLARLTIIESKSNC